jgi:chondroitin-sulfate-ABC endolyase/exolyase
MKKLVFIIALMAGVNLMSKVEWNYSSDNFVSFEKGIPHILQSDKCNVQASSVRAKFGGKSLKWDFEPGAVIEFSRSYDIEDKPGAYPSGTAFSFWVYNEKPSKKKLRVEFGYEGKTLRYFEFGLDFSGWRTAWVHYKYMKGEPASKIDFFRFTAPDYSGTLYIDAVIPCVNVEYRFPFSDAQVPFNPHGHERSLFADIELLKLEPVLKKANPAELDAAEKIASSLDPSPKRIPAKALSKIRTSSKALNIEIKDGIINGPHIFYSGELAVLPEECRSICKDNPGQAVEIKEIGKLLKSIGLAWHGAGSDALRTELEIYAVNIVKLLLDQGWTEGHARGTIHHVGYATRELYQGMFMLRDTLRRNDLLRPVSRFLLWLNNTRIILTRPQELSMDYLNTASFGQLLTCLMIDDPDEKVAMLHGFSNYLSRLITLDPNHLGGGFKADNSAFHHGLHYPAYAFGAMNTTGRICRILSGSPFGFTESAQEKLGNVIYAAHIYCNTFNGPFAICGRHPMGPGMRGLRTAFLNMAMSKPGLDRRFAEAYLKIWGLPKDLKVQAEFKKYAIPPEKELSGNWSFNYAGMMIHRRFGWLACVKGYSKWVDSAEIYAKDNRWGRYFSNGTIQLLRNNGNNVENGFSEQGWDWNRMPGATIVHLPLKQLEAPLDYVQQRSAEIMATGTSLNGNGVFGFVLDEDSAPLNMENGLINLDKNGREVFFGNGLKAYKSVFAFGDMLICLGSGISSSNGKYPTETVIFQNSLKSKKLPVHVNGREVSAFPFGTEFSGGCLVDAMGNGYWIPGDQQIKLRRQTQNSFTNKTHKGYIETTGNFAAAWIDHGLAPDSAGYEYVVFPQITADGMKEKMLEFSKPYKVIRKDDTAHIVAADSFKLTGYVIFKSGQVNGPEILHSDRPAVVLIQRKKNGELQISLTDPALNCRPEVDEKSTKPAEINVEITGQYSRIVGENCNIVNYGNGRTTLRFKCSKGFPVTVCISK